MNYNEALDYIHSISNFFCKPGLDRIAILCDKLGNPQNSLKFIHVAGTNGKGSFCAMLASVLQEAGYRVGLYTSPYILKFNERIAVNGEMISDDALADITAYVKNFADTMEDKPTEFELITAIAFEYFKRVSCDIVVLECGLGGRYDATNIISTTILSVITGISIDHTSFLGNTITQIAGEKAGIIKDGVPCLWCSDNSDAYSVIKNEADKRHSDLYKVDSSCLEIINTSLDGTIFNFGEHKNIKISLLGEYQPKNASNVLTAIDLLRKNGMHIDKEHIRNGLMNTVWHGRFELLCNQPIFIADGAHNPEGIESAVKSIYQYFGNKKVNIITGVMKDKDYRYIAKMLSEVADKIYCITPENPRALPAKEYKEVFENLGVSAENCDNVDTAVRSAIERSNEKGNPTIALGSLYMYSQVRTSLPKNNKFHHIL